MDQQFLRRRRTTHEGHRPVATGHTNDSDDFILKPKTSVFLSMNTTSIYWWEICDFEKRCFQMQNSNVYYKVLFRLLTFVDWQKSQMNLYNEMKYFDCLNLSNFNKNIIIRKCTCIKFIYFTRKGSTIW